MKKRHHLASLLALLVFFPYYLFSQVTGTGSRMNEVFKVTELTHGTPSSTRFYDPWEVTYGPDDSLWVTEAKNYKVYKVSPNGSTPRLILDISPGSTFLQVSDRVYNLSFPTGFPTLKGGGYTTGTGNAPQGGLAGLAIHPKFPDSPYVFLSYIWKFVKHLNSANTTVTATPTTTTSATTTGTPANGGVYYKNELVRFTYNFGTGKLGTPVPICETIPGSSDHNSQRIIIAPIGSTYYLFYAAGDMGAGQFSNATRVENAQNLNSYEGKILRFNLDADGDAGTYDKWIPNTNPFNATLGKQSAVWAYGFRNNQGFAYAKINGTDFLYGQQHGPFSDDEINIVQSGGNYGHPLVIGYKKDGNFNSAAAGNPITNWTGAYAGIQGGLPFIVDETHNADSMNQFHTYHDPIFSYYPAPQGSGAAVDVTNTTAVPSEMASIQYIYYWFNKGQQSNTYWASEAPSGLDVYTGSQIPGWKNSLISALMKGAPSNTSSWRVQSSGNPGAPATPSPGSSATNALGKLMRLKLNTNGDGLYISPTNADSTLKSPSAYTEDTVAYFASQNRFRDLAISRDGFSLFAIIDSSSTTSGPTATNPANSLCKGCLIKYTFLGYADNSGKSSLPVTIPVTLGTGGSCTGGDTVVVNTDNKNLWVPITGPDGNILAEIYPNGNILDTVIASFYINNNGLIRVDPTGRRILDRNIKITPKVQPSAGSPVKVRLYFTNAEYTALQSNAASGVTGLNSLIIRKNNDPCSSNLVNTTTVNIIPTYAEDFGTVGKMVQGENITSFSSFYIGSDVIVLPVHLVYFTGVLENNTTLLKWETTNETNASKYIVERSIDGYNFLRIGSVDAKGNMLSATDYAYRDYDVMKQSSSVIYYRLRMMDKDGAFKYSDAVKILLPYATGRVNLFPNPATEEVNVTINAPANGLAHWKLLDNSGRVMMQSTEQLRKGNNGFTINIGQLSTGVYYLQVSGSDINENVKLQKL